MKKTLMFLLASLVVTSALTGCSKAKEQESASSEPTTTTAEATGDFDSAHEIVVQSREEGSGTRGAFIELFGIERKDAEGNKVDYTTAEANITNSTSVIMTAVAGDPYAIGYTSLGALNDTVKAVKIDGAAATVENIKDGSYKIARPFNVATNGAPNEVAQDFFNFIFSPQGAEIINENGYIANGTGGDYTASVTEGKLVVGGSSSVTPVMEKLKEAYAEANPGVTVEVQQSDSTTGMSSCAEGVYDIGMASRELKDSELEKGLQPQVLALDGIAVIVNTENPADELAADDVTQIYTGEVTDWSAVAK